MDGELPWNEAGISPVRCLPRIPLHSLKLPLRIYECI